jgi:hypothetical protein
MLPGAAAGRQAEPSLPLLLGSPPVALGGGHATAGREWASTRADPDVRQAMPARGRMAIAARRRCRPPARPVVPLQPGVPPAARWAAALRPRDEHVLSRGGAGRRGSKLADASSVSCGCWRADRHVREAARMTTPAPGARDDRSAARWAAAMRPGA